MAVSAEKRGAEKEKSYFLQKKPHYILLYQKKAIPLHRN
jgi:hypothetical protein